MGKTTDNPWKSEKQVYELLLKQRELETSSRRRIDVKALILFGAILLCVLFQLWVFVSKTMNVWYLIFPGISSLFLSCAVFAFTVRQYNYPPNPKVLMDEYLRYPPESKGRNTGFYAQMAANIARGIEENQQTHKKKTFWLKLATWGFGGAVCINLIMVAL